MNLNTGFVCVDNLKYDIRIDIIMMQITKKTNKLPQLYLN